MKSLRLHITEKIQSTRIQIKGKRIQRFIFILLMMIGNLHDAVAQIDSSHIQTTPLIYPYNAQKVKKVAIINAGIYGSSMVGLYAAWYRQYPMGKFHAFNDMNEWQQMDKIGHVFSAYTMGKYSMEMWKHTGMERNKRIWIGGLSGAAYQTVIEILDGFSSQWGWSWGDMGANLIGSGLLMGQEFAWDEQKIQFKTSFHKKNYVDRSLNERSNELFGHSLAERSLKDYNGQTYWLSTSIRNIAPALHTPEWLQISVGMGAEGMFGAAENIGRDKDGNINFYRTDIKRYRQWFLAPDIDLTKIKTRKKGIRTALFILNSLKFPLPSLEYSNGQFKWNWVHF
jgi:uncharacterized protein YfiM (DUF2279 family)